MTNWPNPWPGAIDPVQLTSRAYRDDRSRRLATWLGLPADAINDFVARMELSWTRQQAFELEEAAARRDTAAGTTRDGDVIVFPQGRIPRVKPHRIGAT